MFPRLIFVVLYLSVKLTNALSEQKFQIIILVIGENPSYGYYASLPMFDAAFHQASLRYPDVYARITRHVLYRKNATDCADAAPNALSLAGQVYDLMGNFDGITILLFPGCSSETTPLGDLARELDVLLLASNSNDGIFLDQRRFPTFVSFGPGGHGGPVPALKAFLTRYSLTTITVLYESPVNYLSLTGYFGLIERGIRNTIGSSPSFAITYYTIDSVRNVDNSYYSSVLQKVRRLSRVIVMITREDAARRIMIAAHLLNMTITGDFVFFYSQANLFANFIGISNELPEQTTEAKVAPTENIFKPLIFIRFDYSYRVRAAKVFELAAEIASSTYNYTFGKDEKINEVGYAAYEAAAAFFQVFFRMTCELFLYEGTFTLRELTAHRSTNITTAVLRKSFLNRAFILDSQNVTFGATPYRSRNTYFCRYSTFTGEFQPVWEHVRLLDQINALDPVLSAEWYGRSFPPRNIPICGLDDQHCHSRIIDDQMPRIAGIAGGVFTCLVSLGLVVGFTTKRRKELYTEWWKLEDTLTQKPGSNACADGQNFSSR